MKRANSGRREGQPLQVPSAAPITFWRWSAQPYPKTHRHSRFHGANGLPASAWGGGPPASKNSTTYAAITPSSRPTRPAMSTGVVREEKRDSPVARQARQSAPRCP